MAATTASSKTGGNIRERLREAMAHFDRILPSQAPIKDFVHHNTLHGYQHYDFPRALAAARDRTGIDAYLPDRMFRDIYAEGRITEDDLVQVLDAETDLEAGAPLLIADGREITRRDVYLYRLRYPFTPMNGSQLVWQIEEMDALESFQDDVPEETRRRITGDAGPGSEAGLVADLWSACLKALGLEHYALHPEDLMDLSPDQADAIFRRFAETAGGEGKTGGRVRHRMDLEAQFLLGNLLKRVGKDITLRGVLLALTGVDLMDDIRPLVIRYLGNYLDLGVAAWHSKDKDRGFFTAWRASAGRDFVWALSDLPEWRDEIADLPADVLDVVILEMKMRGLPENAWIGYLECLALELPGWSGMFLWRHGNPGYEGLDPPIEMLDYLAVRLVLERLFAMRLCRRVWKIAPDLDFLNWHFHTNKDEFLVRYSLFNSTLPEYAVSRAHRLVAMADDFPPSPKDWSQLAHVIWTWRYSPAADRTKGHTVYGSGWQLFRLSQHLGLGGDAVRALSSEEVEALLNCLDQLTPDKAKFIWLRAYENHYRDQLFEAVAQNHGRGRWKTRETAPDAQVVFCMDDREESIRRHLEEHNPAIETFGAAGFFGVAMNWTGLDDANPTALCPVVVSPAHEVRESAVPEAKADHDRRRKVRLGLKDFLLHGMRHRLVASAVATAAIAPAALFALAGKIFVPLGFNNTAGRLRQLAESPVPTVLELTAEDDGSDATPEHNRLGFTDTEQADHVEGLLRTIGLTGGFAPLVVVMGHGSTSENNPHRAAYDCGACSGRHGGPNARVFAAMANRSEVRILLRGRGIDIPETTWFVGSQHNTCDETFIWYDPAAIPEVFETRLRMLGQDLYAAARRSAHERCRKFVSAPDEPSMAQALDHVQGRRFDISQARPELGHVTNAAAFIGRRSLSQGAFFDRRVFLISYDPRTDPDGTIVENILLNAGPVSAGINLEYYFSTVNNAEYGCGSKTTHNVTGFFGIMDGTESDLRTGLPLQMIEIHEAMRLQVLVEAKTEVLTDVYKRQPPLQELVGNGWLLLSAKDPDSAAIHVFDPKRGWIPWHGDGTPLPTRDSSVDCYKGHREHLPPALIRQAGEGGHA